MEVEAGATTTVTVTYSATAGPTLNLMIGGLQLTQSVQRFDNTVPLITGRDALLRVTALANSSNGVRAQVRVRLYQGNTEVRSVVIESPADTVPTGRRDGEITTTWNTPVEGSLVQPGLRVVADVDPSNAVPEADETDNMFPASGRLELNVRTAPPLAITLVPVLQTATNLQGDVTASNRRDYLDLANRMYPLPGYSAFVREVYTTSAPALQPDNANGAWFTVLNEIAALRAADPEVRHYYGVVRIGYGSGQAGLGFIGTGVAIGYDNASDRGRIAAHELGHTWGREHAPCGNPVGQDPSYPYPGGRIERIGWDPGTGLLKARELPDVMGYCGNPWISDYTYEGVMDFRRTAQGRASGGAIRPALLVWGRIVDGQAVLEPAFRIVTRVEPPEVRPVLGRGQRGRRLADLRRQLRCARDRRSHQRRASVRLRGAGGRRGRLAAGADPTDRAGHGHARAPARRAAHGTGEAGADGVRGRRCVAAVGRDGASHGHGARRALRRGAVVRPRGERHGARDRRRPGAGRLGRGAEPDPRPDAVVGPAGGVTAGPGPWSGERYRWLAIPLDRAPKTRRRSSPSCRARSPRPSSDRRSR